MRVVMFYHSLLSDWNHGNAHFLRGVATELMARGHDVRIYEPRDAWSLRCLLQEHGYSAILKFQEAYPHLHSVRYDLETIDLDRVLNDSDLVLVHEWNDPRLVARIGHHKNARGEYLLLFHDTHHRCVSDPAAMCTYDLTNYDGVLAFGNAIRDEYLRNGWVKRAWTWHEAADSRMFRPIAQPLEGAGVDDNNTGAAQAHDTTSASRDGDLVWIGNWGDGERADELREFLLDPVKELGLKACVYGVRYPDSAIRALAEAGIEYCGWLPNYQAPRVFSRYRVTVHVPRRPYAESLPGIPTIRVFEALACGIPLVCSFWKDAEQLFTPGTDYLVARNGAEMKAHLQNILRDEDLARELADHGRRTILERHTCSHRVDQLMSIYREAGASVGVPS